MSEEQTEHEKHSEQINEGDAHMLIELCRRKRASKRNTVKIRHQLFMSGAQTPPDKEGIEQRENKQLMECIRRNAGRSGCIMWSLPGTKGLRDAKSCNKGIGRVRIGVSTSH